MKSKKNKSSNIVQPVMKTEPSTEQKSDFSPQRKYGSAYLSKFKTKKQNNLVSLFVNLPVYEEYKHIDLNKTTIYQQRINHHRPKNINQSNQDHHTQSSQISTSDSKGWKSQIMKYMELKKKSIEKHEDEYDGYPLMRLSKKNERLRKIKTNQKFAGKPQLVTKLQTEQLFDEKPLVSSKTNPLPKLSRQTEQLMKPRLRKFENSSPQINGEIKREFRFREVIQKANKNEKVLINFIGNYFRQKFCPERRYSYQIPKKQYQQEIIKLQIKKIFDPSHNQSMLSNTGPNA